jgi:hypothetical protein
VSSALVRPRVSRRHFLRGAAGVSVALPFLESLPERSAWAAGEAPVFSLFICAVHGVLPSQFFPAQGPLTAESLAAAGKATSHLSTHASNLLFVSGVNWPESTRGDPHVHGMIQVLTAKPPTNSTLSGMATGPSADVVIASKVHPTLDPLTLYAGNPGNGYAGERLSFTNAGAVRPAVGNPYTLYQELVGLLPPGGGMGGMTPEAEAAARRLAQSRNSIHDLVREDLTALLQHPRLGSADRQRLQQHFDGIRDIEVDMDGMGDDMMEACSANGLELDKLEALQTFVYNTNGQVEELVRLHMSLVALSFACNHRRTATLQWGDPLDRTTYDVPGNERRWNFSWICHRNQSDGGGGTDAEAERAHGEIDKVRMQTLSAGLDQFEARGLRDNTFVLWTNHFLDGPAHSYRSVPHILWGSGGGYLKQGEHLSAGNVANSALLTTLINAAVQDTGAPVTDFGDGTGTELATIRA